ncbi:MAG TPA: CHASE3 domain-containing protein [Candidatus Angelobacter sp.]|nr:CHASE3 domain-containing protein [Candidatus Angelobacter sp.]
MRVVYKRFSVIAGFAVLLVVLLINAAITRQRLAVQDNNQAWVTHTQRVMLELTTVESLLADAEAGQRGFLYTGEPRYLAPYNFAVAQLTQHIDKLAELTADNPVQQPRIPQLRTLVQQKLDELQKTITLDQEGKRQETRVEVLTDKGQRITDDLRALTNQMRSDENALGQTRLAAVHQSTRSLIATLYFTTALAMVGLVLLAFYILREMAQREKHAREIRQREEWFRVTLASIGDAVIATDQQGKVIFINPIGEDLLGIKLATAQGQLIDKIFPIFNEQTHQPVENPVAKVLQLGHTMGLANHTVLQRADGKTIPIEDSAAPIYDDQKKLRGVVMVFRDVTAEKQAQDVMRKAEKLAAAGRLAATVAHEINNPLEAVGNLIYIVRNSAGLPQEVQGYLMMAEAELERVSHITRQTLGFYRDSSEPEPVQVRSVIESVLRLYDNKMKSKGITVELDQTECPPILGLQGELKQLMANLISNAADAVGQRGRIRISVKPSRAKGKGVEIRVADSGPGVATENRARIFEPFFTTKKDVGTGLGLWVSKEIAERHSGTLQLSTDQESSLGGAVFTVFLPFKAVVAEAVSGVA